MRMLHYMTFTSHILIMQLRLYPVAVLPMKFAMLTLHFALLAVLVISDLTSLIALVLLYRCQIAMCRLHFAILTDLTELNHVFLYLSEPVACIGTLDLLVFCPLRG